MTIRGVVVGIVMVLATARLGYGAPIVIDFDDLAAVSNNNQPGSTYDPLGVHISTLNSIPDAVDTAGEIFTASPHADTFWLISNQDAVSSPNFAAATDGTTFDVLFSFSSPVTSLSLQTDDALESAQVVRLLALVPLGGGQYQVIDVDEALDDATTSPGNFLLVSGQPFSFALFQTTTEQEGFDNLTFTPIPEPATLGLLAVGLAGVAARRARKHR